MGKMPLRRAPAFRAWLTDTKAYLADNLVQLARWQPELISYPVRATYLAWMDWRQLTDKPYHHLLKYGVALSDGEPFGAPGWLRLNFACQQATLTQALTRMQQAIEAI